MTSPTFPFHLDTAATHVEIGPGGTIILRGSFHSSHDGSVVDAASTTWPSGAPGGATVDTGGLIDFEGGGFHVLSRDPTTHEVHAVAVDGPAPACAIHDVAAPCLPLRVHHQAHSRLITVSDWASSLKGGMQVEVVNPPVYAPISTFASTAKPVLIGAGILVVAAVAVVVVWRRYRRWTRSPKVEMKKLAKQVQKKVSKADPILAGPLSVALESAIKSVRERKVDAGSVEGKRVMEVLRRVDARLDAKTAATKAEDERRAADELVSEVEIALEAAEEAARCGPGSSIR